MQSVPRWIGLAFTATMLAGSPGCGGAPSAPAIDRSTAEATVKGTVKLNGSPMRGGEVIFVPSAAARETGGGRPAKVKDDGTYEVTTLVGHNEVRLSGPALKKDPKLGYATKTVEIASAGGTVDLEFP